MWFRNFRNILGLVGLELIFFTAAHTVLCFWFATKTVLTEQQCFICCWKVLAQCQGLLCFSRWPTQQVSWDVGKKLGGHRADPNWLRAYHKPYKVVFSNNTKEGSFSSAAIAERLTGHQDSCWEAVSDCLCIASCFPCSSPHLLNSLYLDPQVFLTFALCFLPQLHWGWGWVNDWASASWGQLKQEDNLW